MNRKSSDGDFFGSLSSRGRIHNCPDRAPPLTGTDTLLSCSRTYGYSPTVTCKSPHRIRSDESAVDLSPAHYGHVDITRRTNIPHHYCYAPCKSVFCSDRTCRVVLKGNGCWDRYRTQGTTGRTLRVHTNFLSRIHQFFCDPLCCDSQRMSCGCVVLH